MKWNDGNEEKMKWSLWKKIMTSNENKTEESLLIFNIVLMAAISMKESNESQYDNNAMKWQWSVIHIMYDGI